jgi:adenosylhomocysteine nucleosidase
MSHPILIACALPQELAHTPIPHDVPVVFTGIGKLNAALSLTQAMQQYRPSLVVNFGTAGRISKHISGLVEVASVIQHDMDAEPLSPRGITPLDDTPSTLLSQRPGVRCATGDKFMRDQDPWLVQQQIDIVDMELFALALTCHRQQTPWRSFKFITDDTDEQAGQDWQANAHQGRSLFLQQLEQLLHDMETA